MVRTTQEDREAARVAKMALLILGGVIPLTNVPI
jgi:hypothetical protein